jgi:hypothetical protein
MSENRKLPLDGGMEPREVGPNSGPAEVREAIIRRVGTHFHECRALPVGRVGDHLDFGGRLALHIGKVEVGDQGMIVDYSLEFSDYPGRTIAQPIAFPGGDRERDFLYCVQMLTDGVLAPALRSLGFELPQDEVEVLKATSVTSGQPPVEWDFFSGYTVVYSDSTEAIQAASQLLNKDGKLFKIVFADAPNLMAEATLHWWKIFYSRFPNGTVMGDLWYDDIKFDPGFQAVCALALPPAPYLMFRQFGVFRPATRAVDTERLIKIEDVRAGGT